MNRNIQTNRINAIRRNVKVAGIGRTVPIVRPVPVAGNIISRQNVTNVPVVINNFNRFSTTKKMVEDLQRLGFPDIYIIDNGSNYPALLQWYSCIEGSSVKVVYSGKASNQLSLWNNGANSSVAEGRASICSNSLMVLYNTETEITR